ncbi:MAG: DUF1559 domain-containing protein [Pirellulaceae bacterium]
MIRISSLHDQMFGLVLILIPFLSTTSAQETSFNAVAPLVDQQTFLIGRLDVTSFPLDALQTRLAAIVEKVPGAPNAAEDIERVASQARQLRAAFLDAGGHEVFLVVSTSDIPAQTPFFVVTSSEPEKLDAVQSFVKQLLDASQTKLEMRKQSDRSLVVAQPSTLERIAALQPQPRAEVTAAVNAIADAPIQLLIMPSADQHRVLVETMPDFPKPWENVTGEVISEGLQWCTVTMEATPTLKVHLVIESKDPSSAERFNDVLVASLRAAAQLPFVQQTVPQAEQLLTLLTPTVQDQRLIISLTDDEGTLQAVAKPLVTALAAARETARLTQSINNLKQIGLAMHNYYDVHKRFPPAVSFDPSGKPLLSWRVHLLPFLEQQALYKQFKLDEPWDSEHNKKLAEIIPLPYLDPAAELKLGLTTYVVPTGEGTIFGGKEALRFEEIRDGTSNTIMVVRVVPDRAVVWTKPEDLEVKEAAPLTGLVSEARKQFEATFCDGSVHRLSDAIDPKILWWLFQANDGQAFDPQAIR